MVGLTPLQRHWFVKGWSAYARVLGHSNPNFREEVPPNMSRGPDMPMPNIAAGRAQDSLQGHMPQKKMTGEDAYAARTKLSNGEWNGPAQPSRPHFGYGTSQGSNLQENRRVTHPAYVPPKNMSGEEAFLARAKLSNCGWSSAVANASSREMEIRSANNDAHAVKRINAVGVIVRPDDLPKKGAPKSMPNTCENIDEDTHNGKKIPGDSNTCLASKSVDNQSISLLEEDTEQPVFQATVRSIVKSRGNTSAGPSERTLLTDAPIQGCAVQEANLSNIKTDILNIKTCLDLFGLLVVEEDDTGNVQWVACKFCPVYGCKNRRKKYIMAYRSPFSKTNITNHLVKEHQEKWKVYQKATVSGRTEFFIGKTLPPIQAFHDRVHELKLNYKMPSKSSVVPTVSKKTASVKKVLTESEKEVLKVLRIEAGVFTERYKQLIRKGSSQKRIILISEEFEDDFSWIGRHNFNNRAVNKDGMPEEKIYRNDCFYPSFSAQSLVDFTEEYITPEEITCLVMNGVLREQEQHEWSDSARGFTTLDKDSGQKDNVQRAIFHELSEGNRNVASMVLFYLLHGISPSIIPDLIKPMLNVANILNSGKALLSRQVASYCNSFCALGISFLKRSLDCMERNWAISLTTRVCAELGNGAVEVLISLFDSKRNSYKVHLVSVKGAKKAGDAVIELLDAVCSKWRIRLLGICSGLDSNDTVEKAVEAAIFKSLRDCNGTSSHLRLVDMNVATCDKPIYPLVLSRMTPENFAALIEENEERLALAFDDSRMKKLRAQQALIRYDLFLEKKVEDESHYLMSWRRYSNSAVESQIVADGLSTLWRRDFPDDVPYTPKITGIGLVQGKKHTSEEGGAVNAEVERVFWGRLLLQLSFAAEGFGQLYSWDWHTTVY